MRLGLLFIVAAASLPLIGGGCASPSPKEGADSDVERRPDRSEREGDAEPRDRSSPRRERPSRDRLAAATRISQEELLHDRSPGLRRRTLDGLLRLPERDGVRRAIWQLHRFEGSLPPAGPEERALPELARVIDALEKTEPKVTAAALAEHADDARCPIRGLALVVLAELDGEAALRRARPLVALREPRERTLRVAGIRVIARRGGAQDVLALGELVGDPDVADDAIDALDRIATRDPSTLVPALRASLESVDADVRRVGCELIVARAREARSGPRRRPLQALRPDLVRLTHDRPEVAAAAVHALSLLGPPDRSSQAAFAEALTHREPRLRYEAIRALVAAGDPESAAAIAPLTRDEWETVRAEAIAALGALGARPFRGAVEKALEDTSPRVRLEAARALRDLGSAESVPVMLRWLRRGASKEVVIALAEGLGAIGDDRAVVPLVSLLADADPRLRAATATALGEIGGPVATEALVYLLDDANVEVRLAAVEAVAKAGDRRLGPVLIEGLENSRSAGERLAIALALHRLGNERAAAPIIREQVEAALAVLDADDREAREGARSVLVAVGGRDFGYDPLASADERKAGVEAARQWWAWESRRYRQ